MKKYCIIILLLCFHCIARGQTFGYGYWFDNDLSARQTGIATLPASPTGAPEAASLHIDADVSALAEGFHTLHVAVDDGQGNIVRVENAYFLKSQTDQLRVRCYVDGLLHSEQTVEAGTGGLRSLNVDMTDVPTGLHQLHLMATTQGGTPVATYSTYFVRMATTTELQTLTARCYVDGLLMKTESMNVGDGVQTIDLDLENTALGTHRLDVTLQTEGSAPVAAYSRFFIRNATTSEQEGLVCTCYIDGVEYSRETVTTGSGVHHIDLDVNKLSKGLHHLHVSAMTTNGKTTSVYNAFFLRMATATQLADENMKLYYKFDTGQHGVITGEKTAGGYHFAPDVSALPSGLHHATFMFTDGSSTHGETRNVFFYKESTASANRYQYWLNGDTASAKTVMVENAGNPTQIVTTLTPDPQPLRPGRYHFEVQEGKPYAYAVNDLTMRFYNEYDASVDTTASYIDVTTGGEVTELTPLHPEEANTQAPPVADAIRWFVLTLAEDSGLEVKTSRPATVQVYSPTGELIHEVSGAATADYTGPTSGLAEGTYWVAVHSVDTTATSVPDELTVTARFTEPATPIVYDRFTVDGITYVATAQNGTDWTVSVAAGYAYNGHLEVPAAVSYDSHTWQVTGVESRAFAGSDKLVSVSLPATAVNVGDSLFSGAACLAAIEWAQPVPMTDSVVAGLTANPNLLVYVTDSQYAPAGVENIVAGGTAAHITLYDAPTGNDFYCPTPFTTEYISYTHHYGQTSGYGAAHGWESITLPFDVQRFVHEEKGAIYPMATYVPEDSTQHPFWMAALGSEGFYEVSTLSANTPYIICMPNNAAYEQEYNLDGNVTFSAESVEVHASDAMVAYTWGDLMFIPNFQQTAADLDYYALNATNQVAEVGGEGDAFVRGLRTVHPFEAYMVATGGSGAKERIPIADCMATPIAAVPAATDGVWRVHDLTGRQLRETTGRSRALQGLPPGVYIVNGMKVLVK